MRRTARTTIRHAPATGEDAHQIALIDWCHHYRPPGLGCALIEYIFHIPNGGKRHKKTAVHMKRMGAKAGVSDLFIPIPNQGKAGLWIEMKDAHTPGNGKRKPQASKEQKAWLEKMQDQNYSTAIAYGWFEARKIITNYFEDTRYD